MYGSSTALLIFLDLCTIVIIIIITIIIDTHSIEVFWRHVSTLLYTTLSGSKHQFFYHHIAINDDDDASKAALLCTDC